MHSPTNYVAGFLFNQDQTHVALVEKQKPDWQRGKLNAIGGKIEGDEDPFDAMVREFREETGATVTEWRLFCTLRYRGGEIYFFTAIGNLEGLRRMEEEDIVTPRLTDSTTHNDSKPPLAYSAGTRQGPRNGSCRGPLL